MKILVLFFSLLSFNILAQDIEIDLGADSVQREPVEIIDPIETAAQFPGGMDSLKIFIEENNEWQVGQKTINGTVFVGFVVEADGSISNIKIVKGLEKSCDKEAIKIVQKMPNWIPAEMHGHPVKSQIIYPIKFNGLN